MPLSTYGPAHEPRLRVSSRPEAIQRQQGEMDRHWIMQGCAAAGHLHHSKFMAQRLLIAPFVGVALAAHSVWCTW
jgi:hypothetical protein